MRAFRSEVLNEPNPTSVTESPRFSALPTPSRKDSTAAAALALLRPASIATFSIRSCLFMVPPPRSAAHPRGFAGGQPFDGFRQHVIRRWGRIIERHAWRFDGDCRTQ